MVKFLDLVSSVDLPICDSDRKAVDLVLGWVILIPLQKSTESLESSVHLERLKNSYARTFEMWQIYYRQRRRYIRICLLRLCCLGQLKRHILFWCKLASEGRRRFCGHSRGWSCRKTLYSQNSMCVSVFRDHG